MNNINKQNYFCLKAVDLKNLILFLFLLSLLLSPVCLHAQDSVSNHIPNLDSTSTIPELPLLLQKNKLVHASEKPISIFAIKRSAPSTDELFYLIVLIALGIGILKWTYRRYVENLFRVFFNSSLRQSQLTDQLLLAKWPSLFFNIVFFLVGGLYAYLLLNNYHQGRFHHWRYFFMATLFIAGTYLVKAITIRFLGWLTGFRSEASSYIFVVFLLNKMTGLFLLPMVILIAFANDFMLQLALFLSFIIIGAMFILRYIRSYALLQYRLHISPFHFLLYLVGVEWLPILMIYHASIQFLAKSL